MLRSFCKSLLKYKAFRLITGFEDKHWGRIVCIHETQELIRELNPGQLDVLEISGNQWQTRFEFKTYTSVHYPDFDICTSKPPKVYDLIIAEQVFEHLLWPYKACKNVYASLTNPGFFLIATPFLVKIHNYPADCTRWTETGLKYFLAESGFPLNKTITGSWGNRACITANFKRWKYYNRFLHSLKNEPGFPFVVWALAQK